MALGINIVLGANTVQFNNNIKKATRQAEQQLNGLAGVARRAFDRIGAINFIGGALSAQSLVQTADAMQSLASKVRLTTTSAQEYTDTLERLRQISNANQAEISATVGLYTSSKRALDALGKSQSDVLLFTENLTKAMAVGGGSAEEQKNALTQLGQALNMGALKGQEFNSVSAQAPIILDLLTEKLGVTRAELKEMGSEGELTANVIFEALAGAGTKLDGLIAQMPITMSGAFTVIRNEYSNLVHDVMNGQNSISSMVVNSLLWVGENFRTLVGVGATLGVMWLAQIARNSALGTSFAALTSSTLANTKASIANAFSVQGQINAYNVLSTRLMLLRLTKAHYLDMTKTAIATTAAYARSLVGLATSFNTATAAARLHTLALAGVATAKRTAMGVGILATRAVTGLGGAFLAFGRIITAHPIIALTAVIGAVIARTEGLNGAIKSLGEAFSVAGILAVDFVGGVVDGLGMAWTATANYFDNLMGGSANATNFAQTAFGGFFAGTHKGFVGVLQITARVFDLAGASVVTFAQYAWKNISSLGTAIVNVFKGVGNFIASVLEGTINHVIGNINSAIDDMNAIAGMFGLGQIPRLGQVSIGRMSYGSTEFGFGGFNASVAQNNAHALETKVVNAYEQVQQSANRANTANLGLAESMTDVASASDKAGAGAKKADTANKGVAESAKLAQDEIDKLNKAYIEQLQAFQKTEWELHKPFISELDKINFKIEHGEFVHALDKQKEDLRKLANAVDQSRNIDTLRKMDIGWTKEIAMLGKDSSLDELIYDLNDVSNILSTFDKENILSITYDENGEILEKITAYDYYLKQAVNYDISKASHDLNKQNLELYNQLELLTAKDELHRNALLLQQEEVAFLGKYSGLLEHGFDEQYQEIKTQFERHKQLKEQLFIQTQYNDLVQSLKTEEEKRTDTLNEQLNILGQMSQSSDTRLAFSKLAQNSLNYDYQVFKAPELSAIDKVTEQANNLTNTYNQMLTVLAKQRQKNLLDETTYQDRLLILQQNYANSRLKVEQDLAAAKIVLYNENLATASSVFDTLADFTKNYASESSSAYRSMFFMAKSVNLATAGMNLWLAASDAFAKTQGSVWQKTAAAALAVAKGGQFIAMIKAMTPIGQAHDGIMSVPKSGTWNLEKGERVLPRHTAQNLDNTLNRLQGRGETKVIINNYTSEKAEVQKNENGDIMVVIGKVIDAKINQRFMNARRQGGELYGR